MAWCPAYVGADLLAVLFARQPLPRLCKPHARFNAQTADVAKAVLPQTVIGSARQPGSAATAIAAVLAADRASAAFWR